MLVANNGAGWDVDAVERLNGAAARPGIVIQFGPDGTAFEPQRARLRRRPRRAARDRGTRAARRQLGALQGLPRGRLRLGLLRLLAQPGQRMVLHGRVRFALEGARLPAASPATGLTPVTDAIARITRAGGERPRRAAAADARLLRLLRGDPSDEDLLALSRALIADPEREGLQLIARDGDGRAIGFATIFWTWSTSDAARLGIMNDLFVAEALAAAGRRGADRGLPWRVRPSWHQAPRLADGPEQRAAPRRSTTGSAATREQWVDYWIAPSS